MNVNRIKVKVCGMTQPGQVEQLVDLGVDAIGMILHADSPRLINIEEAKRIRDCVPAFVSLVGVVVDCTVQGIHQLVDQIGLDIVQLHGNEDAEFARSLNLPYIKAIRARSAQHVEDESRAFPEARAILLDPYVKGMAGGTGMQLDEAMWPKECDKRLVLAGGLSAENIAHKVDALNPFAVDINSAVETSPGIKDMRKVQSVLSQLGR